MKTNKDLDLVYYTFERFEQARTVRHAFSTKLGGVSDGPFYSMNLGFSRGDKESNVLANYKILCEAIGINTENLVFSAQTHKTNVVRVGKSHRGNGIYHKNEFKDVDGLITNEPETALVTFYADCVPIFLLDPVKKAIGLCHAGWKGTINKIAEKTVRLMVSEFGSEPCDILAGIAPSIGPCCFETDEQVYSLFENEELAWEYVLGGKDGKKNIDLWGVNKEILINAGINPDNIETASVCTKCNAHTFYSHRMQGEKRGSLAAIMELI